MNEKWFEEAFQGELEVDHKGHPPDVLLLGYVLETLEERTRKDVSLHVATCSHCSMRVNELRTKAPTWDPRPSFLPDPLRLERSWKHLGGRMQSLRDAWREITELLLPKGEIMRKPVLVHVAAYGSVGLLILAVNLVLNRLLVPRPSPFASPAKVYRWWVHLYWILLPVGFFLGWRVFRLRKRRTKNEHSE